MLLGANQSQPLEVSTKGKHNALISRQSELAAVSVGLSTNKAAAIMSIYQVILIGKLFRKIEITQNTAKYKMNHRTQSHREISGAQNPGTP